MLNKIYFVLLLIFFCQLLMLAVVYTVAEKFCNDGIVQGETEQVSK